MTLDSSLRQSSCNENTINIEFEDLSYHVKGQKTGKKEILKDINGTFRGGKFVAILGASGAGKTSLLNILAGYVTHGTTGNILINGCPRDLNSFHRISTYIMQEDLIQPHLTAKELLIMVANLKLPTNVSTHQKKELLMNIVYKLGLESCLRTRTERMSGGERKRLSIALELIGDPYVIFADEPTSGLDSFTVNFTVDILKNLATEGRTVICTVHQPSVSIMEKFDQVYFLADGLCVYNGCTSQMLSFLKSVNMECPLTYSYSEYLIETVETNPTVVHTLSNAIQNGKINCGDDSSLENVNYENNIMQKNCGELKFQTSPWTQFCILLKRMLTQQLRNKKGIAVQLFHHMVCGFGFGVCFMGIGDNGRFTISNFYLCWLVITFFIYTYYMYHAIMFPIELDLVRREFINRWYGLKAYFLAVSVRNIPIMFVLGTIFLTIVYLLNGQPFEIDRYLKFITSAILMGLVSEGLGLAIGCTFSSFVGSIVAASIMAPFALIVFHGLGYGDAITSTMKIVLRLSFVYYGLVSNLYALFDERPPFQCEDGCLHKNYRDFFRDLGILDKSYYLEIMGLFAYCVLFRGFAYLVLSIRLKSDLVNKNIPTFLSKIFREK